MKFGQAREYLSGMGESYSNHENFIDGINLLAQHNPNIIVEADRGIVYCGEFMESTPEEDIILLNNFGFHLGEDGFWAFFT